MPRITDGYKFYQKLNYNCPEDEKNGTGPGSCSNDEKSESDGYGGSGSLEDKAKQMQRDIKKIGAPLKVKKDGKIPSRNIEIAEATAYQSADNQNTPFVKKFMTEMSTEQKDKILDDVIYDSTLVDWLEPDGKLKLTADHVQEITKAAKDAFMKGMKGRYVKDILDKMKNRHPDEYMKNADEYIKMEQEVRPWVTKDAILKDVEFYRKWNSEHK